MSAIRWIQYGCDMERLAWGVILEMVIGAGLSERVTFD